MNSKSVYIETYGCQMNVYDSQRMEESLLPLGFRAVSSPDQADLVIQAVDKINKVGIMKTLTVQCTSCNHTWEDALSFDPASFFGKRS